MTTNLRKLLVWGPIVVLAAYILYFVYQGFHEALTMKVTPGYIQLSREDYNALVKGMLHGDAEATDRLANYYFWGEYRNEGIGLLLREKATLLGNDHSKVLLKDFLDRYGIDIYRQFVDRTNAVAEQELLNLLGPLHPSAGPDDAEANN